jgi:hypothetical protein
LIIYLIVSASGNQSRTNEFVPVVKPNGYSLDPYFNQTDDYSVYFDGLFLKKMIFDLFLGYPYHFFLLKHNGYNMVDFYLMQLLKSDHKSGGYCLYRRHGRLSIYMGTAAFKSYNENQLSDAIEDFKTYAIFRALFIICLSSAFYKRTRISWDSRYVSAPVKGRHALVECNNVIGKLLL